MNDPHVTLAMIDTLISEAQTLPRRRKHLNLHSCPDEPCQRLLNAMEPDSYIRPHRHLGYHTNECLIALRGSFALFIFDDAGRIQTTHRFGGRGGDVLVVELRPSSWHTVVALESGSVLFETKSGPFDAGRAKNPAAWAPAEGSDQVAAYLSHLRSQIPESNDQAAL